MTERNLEKAKLSGKERLIQAALTLAQKQPFDEVTIDDIVKTAELSRPAFYYHFVGGEGRVTRSPGTTRCITGPACSRYT